MSKNFQYQIERGLIPKHLQGHTYVSIERQEKRNETLGKRTVRCVVSKVNVTLANETTIENNTQWNQHVDGETYKKKFRLLHNIHKVLYRVTLLCKSETLLIPSKPEVKSVHATNRS